MPRLRRSNRLIIDDDDCIIIDDEDDDVIAEAESAHCECEDVEDESDAEDDSKMVDEKWILDHHMYWERDGNPLPKVVLTDYSVFNKKGTLVSLESLEKHKTLFFRATVLPVSSATHDPVPCRSTQPIIEWWSNHGSLEISYGFSTEMADYYLKKPSSSYAPFLKTLQQKVCLSKLFIAFLEDHAEDDSDFDEVINHMAEQSQLMGWTFSKELLLQNAEWLAEQVVSYDEGRDPEDPQLALCVAFKAFLHVSGLTSRSWKLTKKSATKDQPEKMTATTTENVQRVFSKDFRELFGTEMNGDVVQLESDDEEDDVPRARLSRNPRGLHNRVLGEVVWGETAREERCRTYYRRAYIGDVQICPGNYVKMEADNTEKEPHFGRIISLFENEDSNDQMCHIHWMYPVSATILKETGKENELYFSYDECQDADLSSFLGKINVTEICHSSFNDRHVQYDDPGKLYCVEFVFNDATGAFTHPSMSAKCSSCEVNECRLQRETPCITNGVINYWGSSYSVGSFVFVERSPHIHLLTIGRILTIDFHSKSDPAEVILTLQHILRPEETCLSLAECWMEDIGLVFPSDQIFQAQLDSTWGTCKVHKGHGSSQGHFFYNQSFLCEQKLFIAQDIDLKRLLRLNPKLVEDRKRTTKSRRSYRKKIKMDGGEDNPISLDDDPLTVVSSDEEESCAAIAALSWSISDPPAFPVPLVFLPNPENKLCSLDLFSGCGGLSLGLSQSGVSEACWAVEINHVIATAFKMNFPSSVVFNTDCNAMLRRILDGEVCDPSGQLYPLRGEVDIISAGPPCQGYSLLNKFTSSEAYKFKNSLVVTALSYCEYYQPKFFLMENVSAFATHKGGNLLKLVIRTLLELGYQCRFGILQAGGYGAPQCRRRFILMAASQGNILPAFPEPSHAFPLAFCHVKIDKKKYKPGIERGKRGQFRSLTIRDAFHDLPDTSATGSVKIPPCSPSLPWSCNSSQVFDHCVRPIDPLNTARLSHIPRVSGADWRDLPNIVVTLSDGTQTNILKYPFKVKGSKQPAVCDCVNGRKCHKQRQSNTLIPWWLPHTSHLNKDWKGVFGRLDAESYFRTIVTHPLPGVKQGRVLHPTKDRIASVRECARGQGFPDSFIFSGSIEEKYIQVGNSVPPPFAKALGAEILKSVLHKSVKK